MSRKFIRTAIVLSSLLGALLLASPVHAAPVASTSASSFFSGAVKAQTPSPTGPAASPTEVTPAPTGTATPTETTPTGPANPGTGETQQAEERRLDWAPIVIGAILLALLIAILIMQRRRKNTTSG